MILLGGLSADSRTAAAMRVTDAPTETVIDGAAGERALIAWANGAG